jgi:hypothetical protein
MIACCDRDKRSRQAIATSGRLVLMTIVKSVDR